MSLICAVMKPISPAASSSSCLDLGAHAADAVDQMLGPADHELDLLALPDDAVHHAHQDDHAEIRVVPGVDEHRGERRGAVALGRRDLPDDRFQDLVDADAGLGAREHRLAGVDADHVLDLRAHLLGLRGGQVDLVDHRHDLMVVLDALVDVRQRLRFHALRGVHDQQRAFACSQRAGDFVGEVDMARRVHEVQLIFFAVLGDVVQAHGLRLDRDPALLLDVHVIKDLRGHLAVGQAPGPLDEPVRQRRLAMVDVGDNGKIADMLQVGHAAR